PVDCRAGLNADHYLLRYAFDLHRIDAGACFASDTRKPDRHYRAHATLHAILFACSGLIGSDGLRQRHRIDGAAHNTLAYLRKHFPSELLGREGALADILSRTDDDDFRIERHGTDQNDERCRAEDSFHLRTAAGVRLRDIALGTHTEGPIVGGPCSRNAS